MATVNVKCPIAGCAYETEDVSEALAIALINTHGIGHSTSQATRSSGPKMDRPKVEAGITLEEWNVFMKKWEIYASLSGIGRENASVQFFQCASDELSTAVLKVVGKIVDHGF